uniref:Uncharacterized protein n=1 Tax=Branchiostoma floridae TaxID=7739 RepID=C3YMK2_BRAFL|eukprot:XP_002602486.1 hypothetical protein BRAFLDRAFT_86871 [Branchiostoma floridae]
MEKLTDQPSLNDSMTTNPVFYNVATGTVCPEGFNLTGSHGNGTFCAPVGYPIPVDPNAFIYIIVMLIFYASSLLLLLVQYIKSELVLIFYASSLLLLLVQYIKSEREDLQMENYYDSFVKREMLRDRTRRDFTRERREVRTSGVYAFDVPV